MIAVITIIVIFGIGFGILFYIENKKKKSLPPQPPAKKISRKETIIDISGSLYDISAATPINLNVIFEFSGEAMASTPHPLSDNSFTCTLNDYIYTSGSTTLHFSITSPSKAMLFTMDFGFIYDTQYNPQENNLGNKYVILNYVDPISGDTYRTNCTYHPITNTNDTATSTTTLDLTDDPLVIEPGTTQFTLSTNGKNLRNVYLKKIYAFELLPNITEKDEYGYPLWPIMKNLVGNFSGFNT